MERVLLIAILVVAGVFVALTLGILVSRVVRQVIAARDARRRRVLEPVIARDVAVSGRSVAEALRPLLRAGDRRVLLHILAEQTELVRGVARENLSRAFEDLGFVSEWIERLGSVRWWKRADAAENLGMTRSRRAVEPLVTTLEDSVPEVRLRAARALGALGGHAAIRPLVAALDRPDRWSTIRIADILAGAGRDAVLELVEAWETLSPPARLAALDILGEVRELSVIPFLEERLREERSADLRARAADALGELADPSACPVLLKALGDEEWPVRAMAAKALGRLGSREAVGALARALGDRAWWVRSNAAESLRSLGEAGLRALTGALDAEDRFARHQAVMMLQQAGIVDRMAEALASASGDERDEARAFLTGLLEKGHGELLRGLVRSHPRERIRREVERLLASRGTTGGAA